MAFQTSNEVDADICLGRNRTQRREEAKGAKNTNAEMENIEDPTSQLTYQYQDPVFVFAFNVGDLMATLGGFKRMKRFKNVCWLGGGACALFLAYTLSAGPVCRLEPHLNPSLHAKLELFYSPLAWLCMHNGIFGNTMKWYLDRWFPPKSKQ